MLAGNTLKIETSYKHNIQTSKWIKCMKPTLWHYEFAYVEFVASDISPKFLTAIIGQLPDLSDIHDSASSGRIEKCFLLDIM